LHPTEGSEKRKRKKETKHQSSKHLPQLGLVARQLQKTFAGGMNGQFPIKQKVSIKLLISQDAKKTGKSAA